MMGEFHFLRPWWFLALPPLLFLAYRWLWRHPGRNPWQGLVDAHLLRHLTVAGRSRASHLPLALLAIAWVLAVTALAGPTWSRFPATQFRPDAPPLVIVLDLSRSMDAIDLRPSRLEVARAKLHQLLARLPLQPVGLVAYAALGHTVMPLTEDAAIVAELLEALETGLMPAQGSNAASGLQRAQTLLQRAGEPHGHLLLVTDGIDSPLADQARRLGADGIAVSVWAMATTQGGPIPEQGGFMTHQGGPLQPRLEEASLRALAEAGGGVYVAYSRGDADVDRLLAVLGASPWAARERAATAAPSEAWQDQGPWLVLLLLPLAALAFRRGWLGVVVLTWGLQAPNAEAWSWPDLWWRSEQQAWHALNAGERERALALFEDPLWRGIIYYQDGHYGAAVSAFSELDTAQAHYNRGNALVRLGRLEQALVAYEQALELEPGHTDARFNLDLVRAALKPVSEEAPLPPRPEQEPTTDVPPAAVTPYVEERVEPPQWLRKPAEAEPPPGEIEDLGGLGSGLVLLEDTGRPKDREESGAVGQSGDQRPSPRQETDEGPTRAGRQAGRQPPRPQGEERGLQHEPSEAAAQQQAAEGERAGDRPGEGGEASEQAGVSPETPAGEEPGGEPLPSEQAEADAEGIGHAGPGMPEREQLETLQALEQWLERIPDQPGGLLREKFLREYRRERGRDGGLMPW